MNRMLDFAKSLLLVLIALAVLFSSHVRSCLLPFGLALLLAAAIDRPVSRLESHLPRWLAALIVLTIGGLLFLCALALMFVKLWQDVPAALAGLEGTSTLWERLETMSNRLPSLLSGGLLWLLGQLQTQGSTLTQKMTAALAEWAAGWAAALPGWLFSFGVLLLAAFYAASDWSRVKEGLQRLLPEGWETGVRSLLRKLKRGALGWLGAQGRLMAITFFLLGIGLSFLRVPGAWTAALVIALADALPFFGSGILLVPWALFVWFQGRAGLGLGLALLWLAATVCRSVLEPRFIGRQAGTSPLVTLLVMYAGLKLFGLPGLILGPITLSAGMAVVEDEE